MKKSNDLAIFLVGVIMLAAGLYWFCSSVTVSTGFYAFSYGGMRIGGLVVVPLLAGICWVFAKPDSIFAKALIVIGVVIIIASIIMGTHLTLPSMSLYQWLIMLVCIFGGFTLVMRVLLKK
ncbi:hypothetical protein ACTNBM_07995 [Lachnospiraceae bacterium HCP1S3_C3]|nr:hypothetical protein [Lachnospiraceae bacterium]MDD6858244.1 hypothetical protein [Lachnospiraceae bacterium]